jgi:caa(3)-type oxidase subunit IV
MSQHVISVRTNVVTFVVLLVLLFATIGAAYLPLGHLHLPVALSFAAAKAVLIGLSSCIFIMRDISPGLSPSPLSCGSEFSSA